MQLPALLFSYLGLLLLDWIDLYSLSIYKLYCSFFSFPAGIFHEYVSVCGCLGGPYASHGRRSERHGTGSSRWNFFLFLNLLYLIFVCLFFAIPESSFISSPCCFANIKYHIDHCQSLTDENVMLTTYPIQFCAHAGHVRCEIGCGTRHYRFELTRNINIVHVS